MATRIIYALFFNILLILVPLIGVGIFKLEKLFALFIPYASILSFMVGTVYKVLRWGASPQPFKIPLVAGQQKSLKWIGSSYIESPHNKVGLVLRMILEIVFFRSLLRNERVDTHVRRWLIFTSKKGLWLMALIFHYSLLVIVLRHLKLFLEPVPKILNLANEVDGLFDIFLPGVFITEILILFAGTYLLLRRILIRQVRYISLTTDYFALFLVLSVVLSGIFLRYFFRVDLLDVKKFALGLFSFNPYIPQFVGSTFYLHLFLVSFLFAYFPFSKLLHAAGVFLSPTRNLENNSREKRYINPWNYPVKVRTYEEWEDEFREMMKEAQIPLEREE